VHKFIIQGDINSGSLEYHSGSISCTGWLKKIARVVLFENIIHATLFILAIHAKTPIINKIISAFISIDITRSSLPLHC